MNLHCFTSIIYSSEPTSVKTESPVTSLPDLTVEATPQTDLVTTEVVKEEEQEDKVEETEGQEEVKEEIVEEKGGDEG